MAYAQYGVNDALAVKLWSKELAKAERDDLDLADLMGESENDIIQVKRETMKGKGDKVTYGLVARLSGTGFTEGQVAEGNGEALTTFSDAILINELGNVVGVPSEDAIDAQRVPFNIRATARDRLANWWKDRKSISFFVQMCGYTATTLTQVPGATALTVGTLYAGMNAPTAPAGDAASNIRQIWQNAEANDQSINSADTYTAALIDKMVQNARTGTNMIRPLTTKGNQKYVLYLHEAQITSLRTNTGTNGWLDIHRTALAGREITGSPIYNTAMGEWNGCVIRRSQDVTPGCNSATPTTAVANVRRSVLLGCQAAIMAFGMRNYGGGENRFRWNEELLDHKRKLEVSAWSIWGLKKAVYNTIDHGVLVASTYSSV